MHCMKSNWMGDKMMEERKEPKLVRRFIPCPQYDVSGIECWLSEMAEQGLLLQKDGFFCGIATFEKTTPQKLNYCLQAAGKSTSMWADNNGDPDAEEVELSKEFGWEYVAKRGEFHIYRASNPDARELHTDKEVHALAMNAMKKRQHGSIFNSIFLGVIYPLLLLRGVVLLMMIHAGTIPIILMMIAGLWMSVKSIVHAIRLIRLQKQVLNGESLGSGSEWKKGAWKFYVNNLLRSCVYVVALVLLVKVWSDNVVYENYIPLTEYTGDVPFKTMEDFIPDGKMELANMKVGNLNTVREWADILSPVNFEWDEAGAVTGADGAILSGGLEVIYHETKADWIAKRLVTEYLRKGKEDRDYALLELEMEELDDAVAYNSVLNAQSVILRKGNKILCARFYTSGGETVKFELSEWAGFLAESLLE